MPLRVLSYAINRLLVLALIILAITAFGPSSGQVGTPLGNLLSGASPFAEIARALK